MLRFAIAIWVAFAAGAAQAQLYWRVDAGYSGTVNAGITDNNFAGDGNLIICEAGCASGTRLDDVGQSVVLSAGFGWRFSPRLRTDLEFGYRGWYELQDRDNFISHFRADIVSMSVLLGAYWDFAVPWGRPYVGAGAGWARNKIDPIQNMGGNLANSLTVPGGTSSGAAWSLMAGMQFALSPRLTFDFGYRFIDLGKIESDPGSVTCAPVATCPATPARYSGMSGRLRAHELMAGLRF